LIKSVESRVGPNGSGGAVSIESVADILEHKLHDLIAEWHFRVGETPELTCIPLSFEERTVHLPLLLLEVIARLRLDAGTKTPISAAAGIHGDLRRKEGYTVAMTIEESRLLQVSIFTTLHKNAKNLDYSTLLPDVVTIADEVDAQLKEQLRRLMAADVAKLAKGN
jgi:hypothetical protein